jgi:hypothetical protein
MAEPILHKSPPEEEIKSDLKSNSEICTGGSFCLFEPDNSRNASYLPGIGSHFAVILKTTVPNLNRLYMDRDETERMLPKGGEL